MNEKFVATEHQHIRFNPLTEEWVLVSPHRAKRPWSGQIEKQIDLQIAEHDKNNPLCPGSIRSNGQQNPNYESTFVFDNDFPALLESVPKPEANSSPFFQSAAANGKCKVICFHPKSNITLPLMAINEIISVIRVWISETITLGKQFNWVQIFENKGETMGCSNPHPHCQIWASSYIPNEPMKKDKSQATYYASKRSPMLIDYLNEELKSGERLIVQNDQWAVIVPYWAIWPYETIILPKKHVKRLQELDDNQVEQLADIMKQLTIRYDNLFQTSFPYSMGWHSAPTGDYLDKNVDHWTLHAVYYPPLLRSATIKKFMVGYEMLAQPQRDITPEQAAATLRNLPDIHYKLSNQ